MRPAVLAALLAIAPLLAGCAADPAPDGVPAGVPAADLQAGRFYAFPHRGGALEFSLDGEGDAAFDLYDGLDRRLGSVGFSSEPPRFGVHRVEGVPTGDVVLRLLTLNGTLRAESAGRPVPAFQPLGAHVERVVLVERAPRSQLLGGFGITSTPGGDPADVSVAVNLRRAPAELQVLASGPAGNLSVQVRSERGLVLDAEGGAFGGGLDLGPPRSLQPLPGTLTPQNLRDGSLTARVRADDLAGVVVLEATSYSRAPVPVPAAVARRPSDVPFTYGAADDAPLAFSVHPQATRLFVWQEGAPVDNASVRIFGPDDALLATVVVPSAGAAEVPLASSGEHVIVLLGGQATFGADRAPSDFTLRPLAVSETVVPESGAGSDGAYAVATQQVDVPRAYALRPASVEPSSSLTDASGSPGACDEGRLLRVDQGGEAILAAREAAPGEPTDRAPFDAGTLALRPGPLTVSQDGFGDGGCGRPAVAVLAYARA